MPVSCSPHPGGGVRQACCIVGLTLQEQADGGLRFPLRRKKKKKKGDGMMQFQPRNFNIRELHPVCRGNAKPGRELSSLGPLVWY